MMWKVATCAALALVKAQQCHVEPGASAGFVWDTFPNAGPAAVIGTSNRVPVVPLSTSNLCSSGHLPSNAFSFAGIEGTEWKAAPKASRRLQGMVIAPMPQVAGILATTAAPAGGVPATPTVAPAATVAPVATAAPAATTAAPLNPTLNIPGFAPPDTPGMSVAAVPSGAALTGDFPTSTSPTVAPVATEAPSWAGPTFKVGSSCAQQLSHVAVAAGIPKPQLRLYFAPCDQSPAAVVAVDLRSSPSTAAIGEKLKDWMCQVDASSCQAAIKSMEGGKLAKRDTVETIEGLVGKGICAGEGVVSSPDKAASAEECRLACKSKIEKNAADESFETCTGFSWDAKDSSCMTYGAWPVKKADPLAGPDASCYSVTPGRRLEAAQEVDLDFFTDLLSGSEGSSHMNIVSAVPNCFQSFAWYSLSKPIDVPSKSIEIIKYMVRKDAPLFRPLAASESKDAVKVLVQPACFEDCSGKLFGACQKQMEAVESDQAEEMKKPKEVEPIFYEPMPVPATRGGKMLHSVMGDGPYADVFSERDGIWAWGAVFGAATLATGFLVTAGCISCYTYQPPQQEVDPNKVMARLLYEGPEGEREVLLQPAAFRTSTSVPGDAVVTRVDISQPPPPVMRSGFRSGASRPVFSTRP